MAIGDSKIHLNTYHFIMAKVNSADVGFEKQIWNAADVLRGSMDASEYKHVVLGLIFLKYISDRFEQKYNELVAEGYGMEEDKDEYTAENIFFVPQDSRWSIIASAAHTPEIGKTIDNAMVLIENENRRLKGVLPRMSLLSPCSFMFMLVNKSTTFPSFSLSSSGRAKFLEGHTNIACQCLRLQKARMPENSTPHHALSGHW